MKLDIYFFINIFVLIVFLFNVLNGYKKGIVHIFFKFISLILNLYLSCVITLKYHHLFKINDYFKSSEIFSIPLVNMALVFIVVFVIISFVFIFLNDLANKLINSIPIINILNRLLGAIFSFISSLIVVSLITILLTLPIFPSGNKIVNNTVLKYFSNYTNNFTLKILNNYTNLDNNVYEFLKVHKFNIENISKWMIENNINSEEEFKQHTGFPFELVKGIIRYQFLEIKNYE